MLALLIKMVHPGLFHAHNRSPLQGLFIFVFDPRASALGSSSTALRASFAAAMKMASDRAKFYPSLQAIGSIDGYIKVCRKSRSAAKRRSVLAQGEGLRDKRVFNLVLNG